MVKGDKMRIYVASSWRNVLQPTIVSILRKAGHVVYDFKNPVPGNKGFSWSQIDENWQSWTPQQYREALKHPIAKSGYNLDITALRNCDACVLVLPSGRSASWEFGWAIWKGKKGVIVMLDSCEPELMYSASPVLISMDELTDWAGLING